MEPEQPEVLLCDTSYLGNVAAGERRPELVTDWPPDIVSRIRQAILAISVITIAEQRSGELTAKWGDRKVQEAARRRRAFLWLPIDDQIVERWALLDSECRRRGLTGPDDNDIWIAATAIERDLVLVTCDEPQSELPGLRSPIYL